MTRAGRLRPALLARALVTSAPDVTPAAELTAREIVTRAHDANGGDSWRQPRLMKPYYDGVRKNEIHRRLFRVDAAVDDDVFVLPATD